MNRVPQEPLNRFSKWVTRSGPIFAAYLALLVLISCSGLLTTIVAKITRQHLLAAIPQASLVIFYFAPLVFFLDDGISRLSLESRRYSRFCGILILICVCQFVHSLSPLVFGRLKMVNEYFNVPDETILTDITPIMDPNAGSIRKIFNAYAFKKTTYTVVTTDYINEHRLWGLSTKLDIKTPLTLNLAPQNTYTRIDDSEPLRKFILEQNVRNNFKYFYEPSLQSLFVNSKMTLTERVLLQDVLEEGAPRRAINQLYLSSILADAKSRNRSYSLQERQFLKRAHFQIHWQILNRWVIHHHNFILGPINDIVLGKKVSDINMQYGFLNIWLFEKILMQWNGINYQDYFKMFFSLYYVYFALFFLLVCYLFKRSDYIALTCLLSLLGFNFLGYQLIFLGPGMNPVRHFFDLFVMLFLYQYLRVGNPSYFVLSLAFSLIGIANEKLFGLFVLLALLAIMVVRIINGESRRPKVELFLMGLVSLSALALMSIQLGRNDLLRYYLSGFAGFRPQLFSAFQLLFISSGAYLIIVKCLPLKTPLKYFALFLLLYSQELLVYYIWGGVADHFFAYVPIYALTAMVFVKLCMDLIKTLQTHERKMFAYVISFSMVLYVISIIRFYVAKAEYLRVFDYHPTYEWNMPRAKFLSTMNPAYFQEAVQLIQRHAPSNGIYMISKYDAFLPFLSGKYSAMPYPEIGSFLVTAQEIQACISTLNQHLPERLFVDTDIDRNLEPDLIDPKIPVIGYLSKESLWRVEKLSLVKSIFDAVRSQYVLEEKGRLLSVYRLKTSLSAATPAKLPRSKRSHG